jgi:ribonuclease-3
VAKPVASSAKTFERIAGYRFKNTDLFELSLTHPSLRGGAKNHNERLEFLGDRVLGLVISEWLYLNQPKADEGSLARQLNFLVRKGTCTKVAKDLQLGEIIRAGTGSGGAKLKSNDRMLGDACEAVIAAVYLDGGLEPARAFILEAWAPYLAQSQAAPRDPKSRLQEWALAKSLPLPVYKVVSREGPDHEPLFVVEVSIDGHDSAIGEAQSKRRAEQKAAEGFIATHGVKQK